MATETTASPAEQLLPLMFGRWPADMIVVAARLGVSDELADGPATARELAVRTGTHPGALHRLLRALASVGLYTQDGEQFSLTETGELLRRDVPGSLRELAIMLGSDWHSRAWDALGDSVRTGEVPFERANRLPFFAYLDAHPEAAETFNAAMTGFAEATGTAIAAAYDFSGLESLVDVGGGHGTLLATVLERTPGLRGVLFDLSAVAAGARTELRRRGLEHRCEVVAGDFFEAVPAGADGYLLTGILHDWDDDRCVAILRSCRAAMRSDGRLLIGEQVLPEGAGPFFGKLLDVEMLVVVGGQERTEAEYQALLERAGFVLQRVVPTAAPTSVLEAVPA